MAVKEFLALSKQTVRNALDGSPTIFFYPVSGAVEPTPEYKEEPVKEWRGQDTAQGDVTDDRTSTSFKYSLDGRVYPGDELCDLLTFVYGTASAPVNLSAPDAAAARVILQSTSEIYGDGASLGDKALALIPNTKKGSSSYSQNYIGARPTGVDFEFKGGEAATMKMPFTGGPWIGAPEQAATTGIAFPGAKAFRSKPRVFLGAGATLTGVAPNYTDFVPNTMAAAKFDDLSIKYEVGYEDKYKMDGEDGPSTSERTKQISIVIEGTIDFADPASGWSSYDAWKARFSGMEYVPVMIDLDNGEIIPGCTSQKYQLTWYMPKMKITTEPVDRKNDGSKSKIKVKLEHRIDPAVNVAGYLKLIY